MTHPLTAPLPADAPIGVYVHIPFCAHICPYCDFTTYAGKDSVIPAYVDAVCRELALRADEPGERAAATLYFGGGTPSLLSPDQLGRIVETARRHYRFGPDAELSMEANPNGLTLEWLRGYREIGMQRISFGAQTLDRRGLRTLGRHHEAGDVLSAIAMARQAGFAHINLDFIFGWPGQTRDRWQADLQQVLALGDNGPDHLSLYSLIVEPGTAFADAQARGIFRMPDDDATADMYDDAVTMLGQAGWTHYEVANWSRVPGGHSRHNALYWQQGDYLGIGAGAFGTLNGQRIMNHLLPETYIAELAADRLPHSNIEPLDRSVQIGESMMLGLRLLVDGVDARAFAARHGTSLDDRYGEEISRLLDVGLIERTSRGIRVTDRGMMLMNDVAEAFL